MHYKYLFGLALKVSATVFVLLFSLKVDAYIDDDVNQKRTILVMRQIGHEILMSMEDCDSRVLPINTSDNRYIISFERPFGFDPDDIVSIVKREMADNRMPPNYFAEVVHCSSEEIVHSFQVGQSGLVPCKGRVLPEDCYKLIITLLGEQYSGIVHSSNNMNQGVTETPLAGSDDYSFRASDGDEISKVQNGQELELLKSPFLIISTLLLLGLVVFKLRKKHLDPVNPDLISIGASQFDKRNMALIVENQKVDLSNKEAALLSLLHATPNEPVNRELILNRVWGDQGHYVGRTLDVFISKLRKKLEADNSVKIVNIRGVGYKLVMD